MNSYDFESFFWLLPDILAGLFIVGWPFIYRRLAKVILDRAIKQLGLETTRTSSIALMNYFQDLSLATIGILLFMFNAIKLDNVVDFSDAYRNMFTVLILVIGVTVGVLHFTSQADGYRDIDDNGISPFWPVIRIRDPGLSGIRVAGRAAWALFWIRMGSAIFVVMMGIALGEKGGVVSLFSKWQLYYLGFWVVAALIAVVVQLSLDRRNLKWRSQGCADEHDPSEPGVPGHR